MGFYFKLRISNLLSMKEIKLYNVSPKTDGSVFNKMSFLSRVQPML